LSATKTCLLKKQQSDSGCCTDSIYHMLFVFYLCRQLLQATCLLATLLFLTRFGWHLGYRKSGSNFVWKMDQKKESLFVAFFKTLSDLCAHVCSWDTSLSAQNF